MARILVIGSINADRMVQLSAPLSAGRVQGTEMGIFTGGAGSNTGTALARLGHEVVLASALGRGPRGDAMLADLAARGINVDHVARPEAAISEPLILISPERERTILFVAPQGGPDRASLKKALDPLAFPGPWDGIYIANPTAEAQALVDDNFGRCPILGQWYAHFPAPRANGLIAAHDALEAVPDFPNTANGQAAEWLVVTHGARGADALLRDGQRLLRPAQAVTDVVDTTGAGDAYAGGLLHGMVSGWALHQSMDFAARLGAEQVRVLGPVPPASIASMALQDVVRTAEAEHAG
tara:strand:+ start:25540 stop:26427 length:888 start_codon:yes stop_codon:yes gene_type:complete